ncbi:DUF6059 family protein [Streptomyces sp. MAI_2237]
MWKLLRPRRVLREIYRVLVVYGTLHTGPEPGATVGALRHATPTRPIGPLTGPAAGHPERLCTEVPLTAQELELARELGPR